MLNSLFDKIRLTTIEQAVLEAVGVHTVEDLLSLVYNFPSLGQHGLDLAKLSNFAVHYSSASFMKAVTGPTGSVIRPPQFSQGAQPPPGVLTKPGYQVPLPPIGGPPGGGGTSLSGPNVDFRLSGWSVRDQGQRGTCVAFAVTACREHLASQTNTTPVADLSEQYLYWATKTNTLDPWPGQDGTLIEYAHSALGQHGTCRAVLWPYNGTFNPGNASPPNINHQTANDPSAAARGDAAGWQHTAAHYTVGSSVGDAGSLLNFLTGSRRPVAISLPVFRDPLTPSGADNWNTQVGFQFGRVLDPPPTSLVIGGHAVCVTGFVHDPSEPMGGWFIFRNSWGTVWAGAAPASPSMSPEPGYGYISATYVEKYLWEMCSL
jgi:hypothetical protein